MTGISTMLADTPLPGMSLDPYAVLAGGQRRVRRRRLAVGAATAVVTATAGVAVAIVADLTPGTDASPPAASRLIWPSGAVTYPNGPFPAELTDAHDPVGVAAGSAGTRYFAFNEASEPAATDLLFFPVARPLPSDGEAGAIFHPSLAFTLGGLGLPVSRFRTEAVVTIPGGSKPYTGVAVAISPLPVTEVEVDVNGVTRRVLAQRLGETEYRAFVLDEVPVGATIGLPRIVR